jgi:hypothetical protein
MVEVKHYGDASQPAAAAAAADSISDGLICNCATELGTERPTMAQQERTLHKEGDKSLHPYAWHAIMVMLMMLMMLPPQVNKKPRMDNIPQLNAASIQYDSLWTSSTYIIDCVSNPMH